MRSSPRSWPRRILYVFTILVMGAVVMFFSDRRDANRIDRMHGEILQLCEAAARGEDILDRLPTENDIINDRLSDEIRAACRFGADAPGHLEVIVTAGLETDVIPDHATHTGSIRVDGRDRLRLGLVERDDRVIIVGYWHPEDVAGGG